MERETENMTQFVSGCHREGDKSITILWPGHHTQNPAINSRRRKKKPSDFIFFNAVKHTFVIVRVLQKRMIKHFMKTKTPQKREDKSVIYTLIWKLTCGETY